jgi:cobalt-zinc-cadmium efflux system membrane fusion protein
MNMHLLYIYFQSLLLIGVLLLFNSLQGCGKIKKERTHVENNCISDSMLKIISFDTVRLRNLVEEIRLTGKVSFNEDRVIRLYPPVGGIVEQLTVSLGDYVQKGQVLAQIRSADMAGYSSQYKTALANLKIAEKKMEVTEELARTGVSSQKDYLEAKQNYEIALAELNRAKRVINIFGDSTREIYYMRAPIAGFIVEKKISQGMTIKPDNDDIAFTLSDLKDVWVIANIFENDLKKIRTGDSVEIGTLAYDKLYFGAISKISRVLDPVTKVAEVRIVLLNEDFKLQPGMYTSVRARVENSNLILPSIPKDAFVFEENKYFIVTYKDNCHMNIINVVPHSIVGKVAYLESSVPIGTRIISKYQLLVYSKLNKKD